MADTPDLYSLVMDDEPTAQEHAAALAAAIRGQKQKADLQQQFGLLGQFTGDRVLTGVGKSLMGAADQGYGQAQAANQQMAQAGERRLLRKVESERNQALAQYHQDLLEEKNRRDDEAARGVFITKETADGRLMGVNNKTAQTVDLHQSAKRLARGGGSGSGAGSGLGEYDPDMVDHWAAEYNAGKGVPPNAKGKAGQALADRITRRAYELDHGASAGSAASDFGADSKSLGHLTQQSDAVGGFIRTFDKNVDVLKDAVAQLHSSNSPFLNKGLRWYQSNVEGDPGVTRFKNALSTVTSEMGKINSGSTGAGGVPISVLQEMEHNLPPNATPAQIMAGLEIARKDSENRRAAMTEQVGEIRSRRDSRGSKGAAPVSSGSAPALNAGEVLMLDLNGKPHAVPESQVQDALNHKWRKG
jgi:hypothetical protein